MATLTQLHPPEKPLEDFTKEDLDSMREAVSLPSAASRLPPLMAEDPDLRDLYQSVQHNLIAEAITAGAILATADRILIERIAYVYVFMKTHESVTEYESTTAMKNANTLYQSMNKEYLTLIGRYDDEQQKAQRRKFVAAVDKATEHLSRVDKQRVLLNLAKELDQKTEAA